LATDLPIGRRSMDRSELSAFPEDLGWIALERLRL
jgi:hypothetical protein